MPRIARVIGVGLPHHVTQRGNYGGVVFENDLERSRYLRLISEYAAKYALSILGYCLMQNHVHFLVVPGNEDSMARVFKIAHMRYAQFVNWKRGVTGHLWQGRFYSCVLGGTHLLAAAGYIERNPVRAGLVPGAGDWEWSSAGFHKGKERDRYGFDLGALWSFLPEIKRDWNDFLGSQSEKEVDEIRECTRTGRPVGDDAFMHMLERRLGRRLRALPIGRPGVQAGSVSGEKVFLN